MKKKICIVTGSRAEYGLFYPLLKEIKKDSVFHLQILATGMHLSSVYGLTYKEILRDGFKIAEKVKIPLEDDTAEGISRSLGLGVIGLAVAFKRLKPDMVVLLGDRYETYAAAIAAFFARIPIAHLHGGEITQGAMDDAIRHAITKMSLLHFTSAKEHRQRVIQLGENPRTVFNVGALGIDNIERTKLLFKKDLEKELGFELNGKVALVTFHPVTLENNTSKKQFEQILSALDKFKDLKVIFTKPNCDMDGKIIVKLIDQYVKGKKGRAIAFTSLGRIKYLSLMKHVDVILGNSSSGIIEMPSFGKPTVNVGDRQRGRVAAKSVIDCAPTVKKISSALKKAFSSSFVKFCKIIKNPYSRGNVAKKIYRVIKSKVNNLPTIKKVFYTIGKK